MLEEDADERHTMLVYLALEKEEEKQREVEDTSSIKFVDGAFDTLSKLQEVFSLSDEDCDYEIAAATTDYWRQTALSTLEDAIAGIIPPSKAWDIIQSRQKESANAKPDLSKRHKQNQYLYET